MLCGFMNLSRMCVHIIDGHVMLLHDLGGDLVVSNLATFHQNSIRTHDRRGTCPDHFGAVGPKTLDEFTQVLFVLLGRSHANSPGIFVHGANGLGGRVFVHQIIEAKVEVNQIPLLAI